MVDLDAYLNVENITKLRDFLLAMDDLDPKFDMGDWVNSTGMSECQTTACIAGWACVKFGDTTDNKEIYRGFISYEEKACEVLGIESYALTESLFYGPGCATPKMGALALDQALDGQVEIDWDNAWQLAGYTCKVALEGYTCNDHG